MSGMTAIMLKVHSESELAQAIKIAERVVLYDADPTIDVCELSGFVEISPADQVAVIWAGTPIAEIQSELAKHDLALPLPAIPGPLGGCQTTVGESIAWNWPHVLSAQHGTWRDWLLGGRMIMADGRVAPFGSRAVKNVAGYDVARLIVGSRGSLAILSQVILRLHPREAVVAPEVESNGFDPAQAWYAQRVLRSDFAELQRSGTAFAADPSSCTLWANDLGNQPTRFDHDWITGPGRFRSHFLSAYEQRSKQAFDPTRKLHPHAFEVV